MRLNAFIFLFYLTLSCVLVFSNGLKQSLTEFRNEAFVRPVAHHRVTLPRASLPIGQQCGIVTLQTYSSFSAFTIRANSLVSELSI